MLSSLNETKEKSASIAESLKESVKLQESLEQEGNAYLPLAQFASRLFFTISDLSKLNNMYRTSLTAFLGLYQKTLKVSDGSSSSGKRIDGLIQNLQASCSGHHQSRGSHSSGQMMVM